MKTRRKSRVRFKRSDCPCAVALDLIGDKWTMLLVRDLYIHNKHLYNEFLQSRENIPTNILAERLKRLEKAGVITKHPYQYNPVRHAYHLTPKGEELFPILREMMVWANNHIPGTHVPAPHVLRLKPNRRKEGHLKRAA